MKVLFTDEIRKKLAASRVVATVTIENVENAKPLAEALLEGGIRSIEITLRTPAAINAIQRVTQSFPEMLVMAGTVISTEQVKLVQDVGALCAVAPGMNRKVIEAALDAGLKVSGSRPPRRACRRTFLCSDCDACVDARMRS